MSERFVKIPKDAFAFKGTGEPSAHQKMECAICGAETHVLSMAAMLALPRWKVRNENTFLIPGECWGYARCTDCEPSAPPPVSWWRRLLGLAGKP